MTSTRISTRAHNLLCRLSGEMGVSHLEVVDRALDLYERERLLDAMNTGFAELRANPQAWSDELAERNAWDALSGVADDQPGEAG